MMSANIVMQKRRLGQTGIQVTPIGLGGNKFSGGKGMTGIVYPAIPQQEVEAIVEAALDGGINWFDTAEMYGGGQSEQALSRALQAAGKVDGDVIVATKWSPLLRTAGNIPRTIGDRLRFLDGYSIDLYMIHQPWSFSSPEAEMEAMAGLVEEGKIRSIGVSNFDADRMRRAHAALEKRGLPLAVNQVQYSLLHRDVETNGVLDTARELGVTIIAWQPLEAGILTGKFHKDPELLKRAPFIRRMMLQRHMERSQPLVEALDQVAAEHGVTPARVALNWLINFSGEIVVAIPGASQAQQARENAAAMAFRLSDQEMIRLDEVSRAL